MKILRTLLLYGPDSLGLSVIYIKVEGFSGKMLKLRLHATRPSFYREARGGGQTGVGFNQPDALVSCRCELSIMCRGVLVCSVHLHLNVALHLRKTKQKNCSVMQFKHRWAWTLDLSFSTFTQG